MSDKIKSLADIAKEKGISPLNNSEYERNVRSVSSPVLLYDMFGENDNEPAAHPGPGGVKVSRFMPVWDAGHTPFVSWIAGRLRRIEKGGDVETNLDEIDAAIIELLVRPGIEVRRAWLDMAYSTSDSVSIKGLTLRNGVWRAYAHATLRDGLEVTVAGEDDAGRLWASVWDRVVIAHLVTPVHGVGPLSQGSTAYM
jgi:hypothetical protein